LPTNRPEPQSVPMSRFQTVRPLLVCCEVIWWRDHADNFCISFRFQLNYISVIATRPTGILILAVDPATWRHLNPSKTLVDRLGGGRRFRGPRKRRPLRCSGGPIDYVTYGNVGPGMNGVKNWMVSSVGEPEPHEVSTSFRLGIFSGGLVVELFERQIKAHAECRHRLAIRARRFFAQLISND